MSFIIIVKIRHTVYGIDQDLYISIAKYIISIIIIPSAPTHLTIVIGKSVVQI